jgi:hypothetical protein
MRPPRIEPALFELYKATQAVLAESDHPWAPRLSTALRRCRLRLQDGGGGYTVPFYWLGIDVIWIGRDLAVQGVTYRGLHTLLHEAAHQCGAVLPEWKLWFGRWGGAFKLGEIYGDSVNSADAIASGVLVRSSRALARSSGNSPDESS